MVAQETEIRGGTSYKHLTLLLVIFLCLGAASAFWLAGAKSLCNVGSVFSLQIT